jgi:phenylacetate-CoA ligase/benzoylacetate-CoA ligase
MKRLAQRYWNEALETLEWAEVEAWQSAQLGSYLQALVRRSPMYAQLYEGLPTDFRFRSLADLQALPFTLKDNVRAAQEASSAANPLGRNQAVDTEEIIQVLSSSGSTGTPIYYGLTARDADAVTDAVANTFFTAGIRRSDVVAHLVGLPMLAGGLPYADGFRRIGATLCWLGGFPTDRILREMRRLRTTALLATTSFGLYLSEQWAQVDDGRGTPSALVKVLCGGEPGLDQPQVRNRIINGLGTSHVGDVISGMWGECESGAGMHFNAQKYVAVEIIDPDNGQVLPWKEGTTGEIVYTALAREATPLVRYRSRDHALVTGMHGCACGRTSPRIRCIGRTDDMLIYKGMNVFPTAIRDLIMQHLGDRLEPTMRIWKERPDQVSFDQPMEIEIEAQKHLPDEEYESVAHAVESLVRSRLQVRVTATVTPPGSLPRSVYKNSLLAVKGVT